MAAAAAADAVTVTTIGAEIEAEAANRVIAEAEPKAAPAVDPALLDPPRVGLATHSISYIGASGPPIGMHVMIPALNVRLAYNGAWHALEVEEYTSWVGIPPLPEIPHDVRQLSAAAVASVARLQAAQRAVNDANAAWAAARAAFMEDPDVAPLATWLTSDVTALTALTALPALTTTDATSKPDLDVELDAFFVQHWTVLARDPVAAERARAWLKSLE